MKEELILKRGEFENSPAPAQASDLFGNKVIVTALRVANDEFTQKTCQKQHTTQHHRQNRQMEIRTVCHQHRMVSVIEGIELHSAHYHNSNETKHEHQTTNQSEEVHRLLAHWDIRVDYFPKMQEAFLEQIGDGERAFLLMTALMRASNKSIKEMIDTEHITPDDIPEELHDILGEEFSAEDMEKSMDRLSKLMPKTEHAYIEAIVEMLPDTWVFDVIVGEDEQRAVRVDRLYLELGSMCFMWDNLEEAEKWLIDRLRSGVAKPQDYINYGHCCFLKGDKMMAFENYLEGKRLCKSTRDFFDLFRPDRKILVEKGIPLEQVYLMEDHLLKA